MTTPDELTRSVNEFYSAAAAAKLRWVGASPIAELLLLDVLVARYPEQARQRLAVLDADRDSRLSRKGW